MKEIKVLGLLKTLWSRHLSNKAFNWHTKYSTTQIYFVRSRQASNFILSPVSHGNCFGGVSQNWTTVHLTSMVQFVAFLGNITWKQPAVIEKTAFVTIIFDLLIAHYNIFYFLHMLNILKRSFNIHVPPTTRDDTYLYRCHSNFIRVYL